MHIAMIGTTAPSHIYPSLAVIAELVRRGHRVTYAVGDSLRHMVEPAGVEVVPFESMLPDGEASWPDDPASAMRVFLDEAMQSFPVLTAVYDDDQPDLFLYDIGGMTAPVLGVRYGVPAVQLSPTYVAWAGYAEDLGDGMTSIRESPTGVAYRDTYATWLRENDIDADPWEWITYPAHCLSLIPRVMQPHVDRVADTVQFVGPCLDPVRLSDRSWTAPEAPVLYIALGTGYNERPEFYRLCIEAFGNTDWNVVISIGRRVDPAVLGDIPANIEVHEHVPQLAVLDATTVFITHAGMGGCTEALWFGVPTVAVPQAVDQFGNAAMLAELGVGVHLDFEKVTAVTLAEAVAEAREFGSRAAELGAEVRAHGGVEQAANAVEAFRR
ncbi:UDP glycosyltransferase [Rhodococcus sp. 06-412-2C]|uniref:macrolide family glycosyltransferase n=1 Tax=unclassified Rhodococcus (in: high G+C Gram-positive bacteria) TaxID=192944 RepID=UPI000B9B261F|nr:MULTISPECIES: macrolide family glycosyltransferase [unclassified Rhodococcus (in: high G+C Gram-positive bacteria)]OZC90507.1 UDP glycosyltransferase [Rhodococcus sp. 06-412-2B]OZC93200.1 UDP glycosyltransferase [Rhodococcus sp. 06-412-2C]